jgi:hypothetical protein
MGRVESERAISPDELCIEDVEVDAASYGPSAADVTKWKILYKKVYEVEIMGELYVYRGITRPEVRRISQEAAKRITQLRTTNTSEAEAQEIVAELMQEMQVRMSVLYPDLSVMDFNDPTCPLSLAGVIPSLTQAIDEASGANITILPREL